jgi:hypothetical protein
MTTRRSWSNWRRLVCTPLPLALLVGNGSCSQADHNFSNAPAGAPASDSGAPGASGDAGKGIGGDDGADASMSQGKPVRRDLLLGSARRETWNSALLRAETAGRSTRAGGAAMPTRRGPTSDSVRQRESVRRKRFATVRTRYAATAVVSRSNRHATLSANGVSQRRRANAWWPPVLCYLVTNARV